MTVSDSIDDPGFERITVCATVAMTLTKLVVALSTVSEWRNNLRPLLFLNFSLDRR